MGGVLSSLLACADYSCCSSLLVRIIILSMCLCLPGCCQTNPLPPISGPLFPPPLPLLLLPWLVLQWCCWRTVLAPAFCCWAGWTRKASPIAYRSSGSSSVEKVCLRCKAAFLRLAVGGSIHSIITATCHDTDNDCGKK